jgi:hypothetical protein
VIQDARGLLGDFRGKLELPCWPDRQGGALRLGRVVAPMALQGALVHAKPARHGGGAGAIGQKQLGPGALWVRTDLAGAAQGFLLKSSDCRTM